MGQAGWYREINALVPAGMGAFVLGEQGKGKWVMGNLITHYPSPITHH
ncbi:MAG TPA: hypothetical protein PLM06_09245 [Anaerolineae bacterium]|nr:hypothetical protein [Anaerolineae bacterium]